MLSNNSNSEFRDIDYSSKNFDGLNITQCMFVNVNFTDVTFINCIFVDCEFVNVDFSRSNMDIEFITCVFVNCIYDNIVTKYLVIDNCKNITTAKRPSETPEESLTISPKKVNEIECDYCHIKLSKPRLNAHMKKCLLRNLRSVVMEHYTNEGIPPPSDEEYYNIYDSKVEICDSSKRTTILCTGCNGTYTSAKMLVIHLYGFNAHKLKCSDYKNGCPYCGHIMTRMNKYIRHAEHCHDWA